MWLPVGEDHRLRQVHGGAHVRRHHKLQRTALWHRHTRRRAHGEVFLTWPQWVVPGTGQRREGRDTTSAVSAVFVDEENAGLESLEAYENFQQRAEAAKYGVLEFLLQAKSKGKRVMGYGAAAKGNTLLNYAGITADLLPAVADRAPSKQGRYLPGSHIPVISPPELAAMDPNALLVLPWNLIHEVRHQLPQYKLVTAIPILKDWSADG